MNFYTFLAVAVICSTAIVAIDRLTPVSEKPGLTAECGLPVPPPDALHQRVLKHCVACHIEQGVIR